MYLLLLILDLKGKKSSLSNLNVKYIWALRAYHRLQLLTASLSVSNGHLLYVQYMYKNNKKKIFFGPTGSAVLTFIRYKQTEQQSIYIDMRTH